MADWSQIVPAGAPKPVEDQRKRVRELRSQTARRREQRDKAAAHVIELEAQDRQRMADAMARGKDAASAIAPIEQARAEAAGATRTAEALNLAIESAEQRLHELVLDHRAAWAERAQRDVVKARADAQTALSAFQAALHRFRDTEAVEHWLRPDSGVDRGKPARSGLLGVARGSASATGNNQPLDVGLVLAWLEETVAAPVPRTPPSAQPLQPIRS